MDHLILRPGTRVRALGHLEHSASGRIVLWVAFPWEPQRWPYRVTGGDVTVEPTSIGDDLSTGLVAVEGIWTGTSITEAVLDPDATSRSAPWSSGPGDVLPRDLGEERHAEIMSRLAPAGAASFLGGGGTADAIWLHVLFITPELIQAQSEAPVRVDVFAAIQPAQ